MQFTSSSPSNAAMSYPFLFLVDVATSRTALVPFSPGANAGDEAVMGWYHAALPTGREYLVHPATAVPNELVQFS